VLHDAQQSRRVARQSKGRLTGKRSAGPFWMSRPVRSQFSSVPAIVTVPRADPKAPPPRPPRPPPLPPGGIVYGSGWSVGDVQTEHLGAQSLRKLWSQKFFGAARAAACWGGAAPLVILTFTTPLKLALARTQSILFYANASLAWWVIGKCAAPPTKPEPNFITFTN
jgi:hypothetical protein